MIPKSGSREKKNECDHWNERIKTGIGAGRVCKNTYELKIISTKGDREQKKALDQIGDKGLFVREIEQELLDGTISLAVHSMKDMPAEQPSGLVFAHAWKREDPRDVLILREAVSLEELPQHAVIGTGSRRRAFPLLQLPHR